MRQKGKHILEGKKRAEGTITVEAALVVPIVCFCIFWMIEQGISLYTETVQLVQKQEMWEKFEPAKEFQKLEFLGDLLE